MKKLLLIALSTFAVSAHAWEPTFYLGGNYSSAQFKPSGLYSNFTVKSLEGTAGVELFDYLAVEARVGAGLGEDQENAKIDYASPFPTEEEIEAGADIWERQTMSFGANFYGSIYLKPYIANEKASFYALIGYTSVDMDLGDPVLAEDETEAGMSYGLGATFRVAENVDFVMEWKKIINADDFDIRGGAVGFNYRF